MSLSSLPQQTSSLAVLQLAYSADSIYNAALKQPHDCLAKEINQFEAGI